MQPSDSPSEERRERAGPDLAPAKVRAELAALGPDARKIAGGLVVVMMREPDRVRDREWLLENFTLLSAKALELGDEDQAALQDFVRRERDAVLNATFRLFLRVAEDMRGLTGAAVEGPASGTGAGGPASGSGADGPANGSGTDGPASGTDASGPASGPGGSGPASGTLGQATMIALSYFDEA